MASFSLKARLRSFVNAAHGLRYLVAEQHNARIHLVATLVVIAAGWYLEVSPLEWCVLLLTMALVWAAEAINTAVEYLADAAVPERHPLIRRAKDIGAAGVLITAVAAVVVGAVIFVPYL